MSVPYYTGDTKPLKFTIDDDDGAVNPISVDLTILQPNKSILEDEAAVDGNEVSYTVPGTTNSQAGHYKVYFVCTLTYGERTHKIEYSVVSNPER